MSNQLKPSRQVVSLVLLFAISAITALAQAAGVPRPSQLVSAKTVFISNDSDEVGTNSDKAYEQFYLAVQQLNRFAVVLVPNDADIVLQLSIAGNVAGNSGDVSHQLRIIDPKTHVVLWSVSEIQNGAGRQATIEKNCQDAVNRLVADLERLTSALAAGTVPSGTAGTSAKKVRLSQEKQ